MAAEQIEQFAAEPYGGVLVVPGLGSGANSPLIVKLAAELGFRQSIPIVFSRLSVVLCPTRSTASR